ALSIGKGPSTDSYLNRPRIIAAAEVADVQAIHPGYGFLSENPDFADSCRTSGFEFIGPPHDAIRKMGLKTEAKQIAAQAEVPCVPGSDGVISNDAQAIRLARQIGYPVLIKAAAGGGGRACASAETRATWSTRCRWPATRPRRHSRTPAYISRNSSTGRGTSRSRSWRTNRATSSTAGTGIARSRGATRSSSKNRPRRRSRWR